MCAMRMAATQAARASIIDVGRQGVAGFASNSRTGASLAVISSCEGLHVHGREPWVRHKNNPLHEGVVGTEASFVWGQSKRRRMPRNTPISNVPRPNMPQLAGSGTPVITWE